jgi:hypothetical protein
MIGSRIIYSTSAPTGVSAVIPNILNNFWTWQKDIDATYRLSRKFLNQGMKISSASFFHIVPPYGNQ